MLCYVICYVMLYDLFILQFMIDCEESVFKFERTTGTLKANSKTTVILKFVPQYPINYHRRITCLVHNQVRSCRITEIYKVKNNTTYASI